MGVDASRVWTLHKDDGLLRTYPYVELRRETTAYMRHFQPHVVVTLYPYPLFTAAPTCNGACPDPWNGGWDDLGYHPDHQHCGEIVLDTATPVGSSGNDMLYEDLAILGGGPWKPDEVGRKGEGEG